MHTKPDSQNFIHVLLIEDNQADAHLVKSILSRETETRFIITHVGKLGLAMDELEQGEFSAVLLDLGLPDVSGMEGVKQLRSEFPNVPVVVLTGLEDTRAGVEAIREGAQDYLFKGEADLHRVARTIVFAVERQRIEEELEQAKKEAEFANEAKSHFLSRMSHEFRTPLTAILGFAQLLAPRDGDDAECVQHILKAGGRLLELIDDVLDIASIETGGLPLSTESVDLKEAITLAMTSLQPLAAQKEVDCRLDGDLNDVRRFVLADRQRIHQIFLNLISNAVKHNRKGGEVVLSWDGSSDGKLRIKVRDTGPGIPDHKMDRLFTPFDRLDSETTDEEGTGLGLSLARSLVQVMGGEMGVRSKSGKGTTFWFELPAAEDPGQEKWSALHEKSERREFVEHNSSGTVLCIDDDLANINLVEAILNQRPGIRLIPAMQGSIGVELAEAHLPDMVFLDVHLPDIPGHEVLRRLKESPATQHIPVYVLSADATAKQINMMKENGAEDYFTKPFSVHRFLAIVDAITRKPLITEATH